MATSLELPRITLLPLASPRVQPESLQVAGIVSRLLATLIDALVILAVGVLIRVVTCTLHAMGVPAGVASSMQFIGVLSVLLFYPPVMEWRYKGQTVGKAFMRLKLVSDSGQPLTLTQTLLRSVCRVVDLACLGVGVLLMYNTPQNKRLGDLCAGTSVVHVSTSHELSRMEVLLSRWGLLDIRSGEITSRDHPQLYDYALRRDYLSPWGRARLHKS